MVFRIQPVRILGVPVHPTTVAGLKSVIVDTVEGASRLSVVSQNLHSAYLYHTDRKFRQLHDVSIAHIDGMPLVFAGRLCGLAVSRTQRITWVDWLPELLALVHEQGWKLFYVGSSETTLVRAERFIRSEYPGIRMECRNGYFDTACGYAQNRNLIARINREEPEILMVGMGMPRQEHWILENRESLNVKVIMTCGAAMEYVAGTVRTPPRWMGPLGLEWLFRLSENPRRFWRRYLVEPWFLFPYFISDLVRNRIIPRRG